MDAKSEESGKEFASDLDYRNVRWIAAINIIIKAGRKSAI